MITSSLELREIHLPLIHFFETSFGRTDYVFLPVTRTGLNRERLDRLTIRRELIKAA